MKKGKFAAVLFIVFFLLAVALICFWLTSKDNAAEPPAADVSGSMEPQIVVGTPNTGGTTGDGSSSGSTGTATTPTPSSAPTPTPRRLRSLTSFSIPAASLPTRVCR